MFEALKLLYKHRPRTLSLLVFLIVSFTILHIFSMWQLDIICVDPVWAPGWSHPTGRYADEPFQCWLWRTSVGEAYDVLFFLNLLSFYGVIIVFVIMLEWAVSTVRFIKATSKSAKDV